MSVKEAEQTFQTNIKDGLETKEAEERVKQIGLNNIYRVEKEVGGTYLFHALANLIESR